MAGEECRITPTLLLALSWHPGIPSRWGVNCEWVEWVFSYPLGSGMGAEESKGTVRDSGARERGFKSSSHNHKALRMFTSLSICFFYVYNEKLATVS